ncbi:MAG TPA: DUF805 domain-containing protein [Rhizomicrobium sp.]|nr:DUF805 domain-containing protein [Rhizomicrobium sp.]
MRLGRAAFWRLLAINLFGAAFLVALVPPAFSLPRPPLPPLPLWPVIALHLCLPIGWLGAQRLHDIGARGWQAWLPLIAFACVTIAPSLVLPLLPSLAAWVQHARMPSYISEISMVVVIATWLGAILLAAGVLRTVFLWLRPGDTGDNRYGPAPLDTKVPEPQPRATGHFLTGRMARLPFWSIMLANTALIYGTKYGLAHLPGGGHPGLLPWISAYLYLPSFAAAVLRLHDRNQSGLLAVAIFVINAAAPVAELFLDRSQTNWMNVAIDILSIYLLFQCWQPGDLDENRYGPPPGKETDIGPVEPVALSSKPLTTSRPQRTMPQPRSFGRRIT